MKKTVCLIGRPNVGKSTIFNRLIGEKKSIIDDQPGITRDRIYGNVTYDGKTFLLIDTGGIDMGNDNFNEDIKVQAMLAIDESDVIVFIVDGKEEITSNDLKVREMLLKTNKKVILAVNKLDNKQMLDEIYRFYELGFDNIIPLSAAHNRGFEDLLEEITKDFHENEEIDEDILKFCIIGRPNVGKSSLINALLNEDRSIVSNVAGTTRDAVDTRFKYENNEYIAIDTAGMRKKGKIYENIEKYSILRALTSIEKSDVILVVIDGETGIREQDKHVAGYAHEAGKGVVIVYNKWDLVDKDEKTMQKKQKEIYEQFKYLDYARIVFTSAKTGQRVDQIFPLIQESYENSRKRVQTSVLNDVLVDAQLMNPTTTFNGGRLKIFYANQVAVCPPTFVLFSNDPQYLHFSYKRYLENRLREAFGFEGTPIHIICRKRD